MWVTFTSLNIFTIDYCFKKTQNEHNKTLEDN